MACSEGRKYPKPELCRKHETVLLIDDSLKYAKECSAHGIPACEIILIYLRTYFLRNLLITNNAVAD